MRVGWLWLWIGFLCWSSAAWAESCIAVLPAGSGHEFWSQVENGAKDAADRLGLKIYYRGHKDEQRCSEFQHRLLQAMANKMCQGVVLAPCGDAIQADIAKLKSLGIPTVYIDRSIDADLAVSRVMTNNYQAGILAGQKIVALLGPRGKVGVLRLMQGVTSTTQREEGFIAAAKQGGLEIVLDTYIGTQVAEARNKLKQMADKFVHIEGVFTPNESSTEAAAVFIRGLQSPHKIHHIGFDMNLRLKSMLDSGSIDGLLIQQPYQIGYQGVAVLNRILHAETVPKTIWTEVRYITANDL